MTLLAAVTRDDVARYVAAVFFVYTLLIILYVIVSLLFSLGVRTPYSRWFDAFWGFLRDVCEPFLRIFRSFIPMIGPLDISPIVAIVVLNIVGGIVIKLISG